MGIWQPGWINSGYQPSPRDIKVGERITAFKEKLALVIEKPNNENIDALTHYFVYCNNDDTDEIRKSRNKWFSQQDDYEKMIDDYKMEMRNVKKQHWFDMIGVATVVGIVARKLPK